MNAGSMDAPSTARLAHAAPGTRRRVLAATAALPLLGLGLALGPQRSARAAPDTTPASVRALDAAAAALFDAAQGSHWTAARRALEQARSSAETVGAIEPAFLAAGGGLRHFFEARNNLAGDLIEAATALSVKDRRWLVNCADRIANRAGELSRPFAEHANALIPRVESLLFLARRMQRALVWHDALGYRSAHDDFKRLWQSVRGGLHRQPAARLRALADALARTDSSGSTADAKALYLAVRQLRDGLQ